MDVPHLFIHSSVDGHLGCVHLGAVMNNATMNIQAQGFVWLYVFICLDIYLGVELRGHVVKPVIFLHTYKKETLLSASLKPN